MLEAWVSVVGREAETFAAATPLGVAGSRLQFGFRV